MEKPHSRDSHVGSGTANVHKGSQVNVGGPVGSRPAGGAQRAGSSGNVSAGGILGLLAIFAALPKKLRRVVVIGILIIAAVLMLNSCVDSGLLGSVTGSSGSLFDYSESNIELDSSTASSDTGAAVDLSVSTAARDKRVTPIGNGRDTVTVMVYMCGTDLESKYGMATADLSEMLNAKISDKVNVIVETGGCSKWKNSVISSSVNQIYKVESGDLKLINNNAGTASMTDPDNLTSFIKYCKNNFPADRNILILWDHGGGSITGYGYDEKNSRSGSMTLTQINSALKSADCVFDWIGYDACLMATLENALVCNNYADYLIASEETEPGTGWYYTNWLNKLSANTSISTPELAKVILDDYARVCKSQTANAKITLSLVDLAEMQGTVTKRFTNFASSVNQLISSNNYTKISNARAGARQYAQSSKINQVDLTDLAQRIGTSEAKQLAEAIKSCVKYNVSTISNSYGLSIYFPYETLKDVNSAVNAYDKLGMDSEYTKCIRSFASLEYGGQISSSASQQGSLGGTDILGQLLNMYTGGSSPLDVLLGSSGSSSSSGQSIDITDLINLLSSFKGRSMPSGYEWVNTDLIANSARSIANRTIDASRITATMKYGAPVLSLTEEEWDLIQTVEVNVFVDDGEGYIDLGYDNVFEFEGNDLKLSYNNTWLTLDGEVVAYYLESDTENSDGSWTTVGRIPALLNGEAVNLKVVFDKTSPYGRVTGAYPLYNDGETDAVSKGNIPVQKGDRIKLLCDYYDYDGSYTASYLLGSSITVGSDGLTLENLHLGADNLRVTYRLTDIYGNQYWVEVP